MSSEALSETERAVIEWRCAQLIHRFALLNDARRFDEAAPLFAEDCIFGRPTAPDDPMVGRDAIIAALKARPPRITRHIVSNIVIEVVSPTEARGESYVTLLTAPALADGQALPVKADAVQSVGGFSERFKKVDGEWVFAERRGYLTLTVAP
jgi:hypothetical protein